MADVMINPPRTIMEVFKMLPEGTLAEVIENKLYMSPTPTSNHQRVITKLLSSIAVFIEANHLGEVFTAPFDVYLDESTNAVQPDILYVSNEKLSIIHDKGCVHGVPDMIIEILSPGNKKHDLVIKKNLYEKFGVKEYSIVDPETTEVIGYELIDGSFVEFYTDRKNVQSKLLHNAFTF